MCKEVDVNLQVGIRRTVSCEVHKVIPTLTKFDQSRDISLKSVNCLQSCLTLIAVKARQNTLPAHPK